MGKKQKHEEHENLERYLVSYADFMTLMFATFVVLYALAQSDANSFRDIEEAIKKAFSQSVLEGDPSILSGQSSMFEGQDGASNPLMLEYMSQKYEDASYAEIIEDAEKFKDKGVSVSMEDRGLVLRLSDKAVHFAPGTAIIAKDSYKIIDEIAKIIKKRFSIHYIQVEGHSDSDKMSNAQYPSNWELSSARSSSVIRYLQESGNFNPKIFIAVGLADSVPLYNESSEINKEKNRRVEIVILKNRFKFMSKKDMQKILEEAKKERAIRKEAPIKKEYSDAVDELIKGDREMLKNVIDMSSEYENETERIDLLGKDKFINDGTKPNFME